MIRVPCRQEFDPCLHEILALRMKLKFYVLSGLFSWWYVYPSCLRTPICKISAKTVKSCKNATLLRKTATFSVQMKNLLPNCYHF